MHQSSCGKVKNPCKICLTQVTNKTGLQCMGACKKWAHYKCLNYTPGKISDIKAGIIKVMCPCPNCDTSAPKEILTNPPYTCSNNQCPANKLPICQSKDCPVVLSQQVSMVDCPPTCPTVEGMRNPSAPKSPCPPSLPKPDVKRPCNLPPEYSDTDSSLDSPEPCPPECPTPKPKPPPCPPTCPSNESKRQTCPPPRPQTCPPPRPTCPPPQTCPPTPRPAVCPPACPSNEAPPPRPRPQQVSSRCPSTCKPPRLPARLKPNQPCPPSCKSPNEQGSPAIHYSKNRNVPVIREYTDSRRPSGGIPPRPCNEPVQEPSPPSPPCPKPPAPCQQPPQPPQSPQPPQPPQSPQSPQPIKHSCPAPCYLPKVSNNYSAYDMSSPAKSPSWSFQSNESTDNQRHVDCIVSSSDSQVTRNKYDPMMSTLEDMCNTMTNLTVQMKDLMAKMVAM